MDTPMPTTTDPSVAPSVTPPARKRGFAAMDPARLREIASKGGRTARDAGVGHRWTTETAALAALKGVEARRAK